MKDYSSQKKDARCSQQRSYLNKMPRLVRELISIIAATFKQFGAICDTLRVTSPKLKHNIRKPNIETDYECIKVDYIQ